MTKEKNKLSKELKDLEEIVRWFEEQQEVDIETGLTKAREGAKLIKSLKAQLKEVENEFEEIKTDIGDIDE